MAEKVSLSFKVNGRVFSYEGNPNNRERQFFDLIIQRNVPEAEVPAAYRDNFPTEEADDAIMQRYTARLAKRKGGDRSSQRSMEQLPNVDPPGKDVAPMLPVQPTEYTSSQEPPKEVTYAIPEPATARGNQAPPSPAAQQTATGQPPLSSDEIASLNTFIADVLREGPAAPKATPALMEQVYASVNPAQGSAHHTPREDTSILETSTTSATTVDRGPKLHIFLQQDGAEAQKMVTVQRGATYTELQEAVQKKINMVVSLSFVDADGMRIDVDDDDSLEMFLSMETKKYILKCSGMRPIPLQAAQVVQQQQPGSRATIPQSPVFVSASEATPQTTGVATTTASAFTDSTKTTAGIPSTLLSPAEEQPFVRNFVGHTAAVYGVAFSPDGSKIVSASKDRTVKIWSVDKGQIVKSISGHSGFVLCCDYSPKGTHVVSCSDDQTIRLWNAANGKKMYTIKEHSDKVYCTLFAGQGDVMASCSCDCTVKVWNVENGSRLASLKPHDKAIFRIGLSQTDNGRYIVTSCDDHTSYIVDWKESKIVRKLEGHASTVWSASFSHDDKYVLTSSMDHSIKMWEVGSGREVSTFTGHGTPVHSAMFCKRSRDTAAVSCARDWTIGVWDVATAKLSSTFAGHTNTVYNLAQKDDMLVSCSLDESLKLWRLPRRILDPSITNL